MPPESESLLFKTADILSRPHSATSGFLSELFREGGDPIEGFTQGLKTGRFSGRDVISNLFDIDPESRGAKFGGLGFDLLNPLDPLNYIGFGGLTKAGRIAKASSRFSSAPVTGKLAATLGDQARAGQRGLLTFGGLPVLKGAPALDLFGKAGRGVRRSKFGRAVEGSFGGKRGAILARLDDDDLELGTAIFNADKGSTELINRLNLELDPLFKPFEKLTVDEGDLLGDLISFVNRNDMSLQDAATRFIGSGKRAGIKRDAFEAAQVIQPKLKQFSSLLDGSGIDRFLGDELGFLPRIVDPKKTGKIENVGDMRGHGLTGELIRLVGQSKNKLNQAQVQSSIQPVTVHMLDAEGQKLFKEMGGIEGLAEKTGLEQKRFLEKHRITLPEGDRRLKSRGFGGLERSAPRLLKEVQRQVAENVKADELIQQFVNQGIAVPWIDDIHKGLEEFIKIDQGRFAQNPLAIPTNVDRAFERVMDVLIPSQNDPIFGQFMHDLLPQRFRDLQLIKWWKLTAIFGATPTSYLSRNYGTGLQKNRIEGLSAATAKGFSQMLRFYPAGTRLAGNFARRKVDGVTRVGNVVIDNKWLWQQYNIRNMHGGQLLDLDILQGASNASKEARLNFFNKSGLRFGTETSEGAVRIPLMLKVLEDTFDAARKNGLPVPKRITALSDDGVDIVMQRNLQQMTRYEAHELVDNINLRPSVPADTIEKGAQVVEAAVENAREAVIRAHFDYSDLTPTEQKLRNFWIPFYTWSRKNIPSESRNMITDFGKYMPFVRAYHRAFLQEDMTPEDLPEWAQKNFAVPIDAPDGTVRFIDFTGFLPFLDIFEIGEAALGRPRSGGTRTTELLQFGLGNLNPFVSLPFEQRLQRDVFTGRRFSGDVPREFAGFTAPSSLVNALGIFRPLTDLDRVNPPIPKLAPEGIFTEIARRRGIPIEEGRRGNRNEANPLSRLLRAGTGIKVFQADDNVTDRTRRQRESERRRLRTRIRRARREGNEANARFFEKQLEDLEKQ